jgi:hypothetical protein
MGVVVVGDIAHVAVDPELAQSRRRHLPEPGPHVREVGRRRGYTMVAPDDHGDVTDIAFGDPADVVLVIPGRQPLGATQITVSDTGERLVAHGAPPAT